MHIASTPQQGKWMDVWLARIVLFSMFFLFGSGCIFDGGDPPISDPLDTWLVVCHCAYDLSVPYTSPLHVDETRPPEKYCVEPRQAVLIPSLEAASVCAQLSQRIADDAFRHGTPVLSIPSCVPVSASFRSSMDCAFGSALTSGSALTAADAQVMDWANSQAAYQGTIDEDASDVHLKVDKPFRKWDISRHRTPSGKIYLSLGDCADEQCELIFDGLDVQVEGFDIDRLFGDDKKVRDIRVENIGRWSGTKFPDSSYVFVHPTVKISAVVNGTPKVWVRKNDAPITGHIDRTFMTLESQLTAGDVEISVKLHIPFDETLTADRQGRVVYLPDGAIYIHPVLGTHEVHGAIYDKWVALGAETGLLGSPLTDETGTSDGRGRFNHFQNGSIFWTPETGAHEVHGAIRDTWAALGWEQGVVGAYGETIGYPVTEELPTADGIGRVSHFERASIYWHPNTGAYFVGGVIRQRWWDLGAELSRLGYPVTNEVSTGNGLERVSVFTGGWIYWDETRGTYEVYPTVGAESIRPVQ